MAADTEITVFISPEKDKATLTALPGINEDLISRETLNVIVQDAGVSITKPVEAEISKFVHAYGEGESKLSAIIATATLPENGMDGSLDWEPEYNPTNARVAVESLQSSEVTDHYAGKNYIKVNPDDVLGVIRRPTDGTDGCNVCGNVLKAHPGKPVQIKFHSTISVDPEGHIIAQCEGVLVLHNNELSVSQSLDVKENVDFSTGHIDFAGSVAIAGGIRPGFEVKAKDDVHVAKLIESAVIKCGRDLVARSGMTGHDRGSIEVGRNAQFPYLNNVKGLVNGNLTVEREIVDCNLAVGNDLNCPNGAILGGKVSVTGSLMAKVLGSEGWTPTTIELGEVPLLKCARTRLNTAIEVLKSKISNFDEQERIINLIPRPTHEDKERLMEISFELNILHSNLALVESKLDDVNQATEAQRKLDVHILKSIHPKVKLNIGDATVQFKNQVPGPIWICWDERHHLIYRTASGESHPLSNIASVFTPDLEEDKPETSPSAEAA